MKSNNTIFLLLILSLFSFYVSGGWPNVVVKLFALLFAIMIFCFLIPALIRQINKLKKTSLNANNENLKKIQKKIFLNSKRDTIIWIFVTISLNCLKYYNIDLVYIDLKAIISISELITIISLVGLFMKFNLSQLRS